MCIFMYYNKNIIFPFSIVGLSGAIPISIGRLGGESS